MAYYDEKRNGSKGDDLSSIVTQLFQRRRKTIYTVAGVLGLFFLWTTLSSFNTSRVKTQLPSKCLAH